VARRFAKERGVCYEDLTLIMAHLGGGISIGLHRQGKVIDVNQALSGEGHFRQNAPEPCLQETWQDSVFLGNTPSKKY